MGEACFSRLDLFVWELYKTQMQFNSAHLVRKSMLRLNQKQQEVPQVLYLGKGVCGFKTIIIVAIMMIAKAR